MISTKVRGYGSAYINGIKNAKGKNIMIFESDTTYDPYEIPKFYSMMQKTNSDLIMGSRLHGKISKGAMPWHHQFIGNPVLTGLLNLLYKSHISDSHCGMRLIKKSSYDRLKMKSLGMEFASEMIVKSALLKFNIQEIPINYGSRPKGSKSKLNSFRDGFRHVKYLLNTYATKNRLNLS